MSWFVVNAEDIGKFILRVSIGAFILVYGIEKIVNPNMMEYITGLLFGIGIPGVVAYGVYVGEIVAPLMVIAGFRARAAAVVMTFTMLVVILLGHYEEIFPLADFTWWGIELQVLFFLNSLAVVFLGAGKFALSHKNAWD